MSPRSRGRPPGRGKRRQKGSRPTKPRAVVSDLFDDETADCWFDEPSPGDRRSWALPPGHGTYRGIDLELLDPGDEGELTILVEAAHQNVNHGFVSTDDISGVDEPFNPRLHVAMHQVVVNQILGDEPPKTWQTVQRLAGLGYDWHNIAHMIAALVVHDIHGVLAENRPADPADYARRLDQLPGDWPPPEALP